MIPKASGLQTAPRSVRSGNSHDFDVFIRQSITTVPSGRFGPAASISKDRPFYEAGTLSHWKMTLQARGAAPLRGGEAAEADLGKLEEGGVATLHPGPREIFDDDGENGIGRPDEDGHRRGHSARCCEAIVQLVIQVEVEGLIGVGRQERSPQPLTHRKSFREGLRALFSAVARIRLSALRVRKRQQGTCLPPFLVQQRRCRPAGDREGPDRDPPRGPDRRCLDLAGR